MKFGKFEVDEEYVLILIAMFLVFISIWRVVSCAAVHGVPG